MTEITNNDYDLTHYHQLHKFKMNEIFHNKDFIIRNKAKRMGITKYDDYFDEDDTFLYYTYTDYGKLTVLLSYESVREYPMDEPIDEQNDPIITITYDNDYAEPYVRYRLTDAVGTIDYVGYNDINYLVKEHLEDNDTIRYFDMDFLRPHLCEDVKTITDIELEPEYGDNKDAYECEQCPVCFEEWSEETKQLSYLCLHSICKNCNCELEKAECPLCRYPTHKSVEYKTDIPNEILIERINNLSNKTICDIWIEDMDTLVEDILQTDGLEHTINSMNYDNHYEYDLREQQYCGLMKLFGKDCYERYEFQSCEGKIRLLETYN